jgi:hypothetical protein
VSVHREELDREADRSERLHVVFDLGGDGLGRVWSQRHVEKWLGGGDESQLSVVDEDASPGASGQVVSTEQTRRHGVLVPLGTGTNQAEIAGQLGSVTERAVEWCPEPLGASLSLQHPSSELERWSVADVLVVATGELGHPVGLLVLVVAGDRSLHGSSVPGVQSEHR